MPNTLGAVIVRQARRVVGPVDSEEGVLDERGGDEFGVEEVVDEGGVRGAAAAPGHGEGAATGEDVCDLGLEGLAEGLAEGHVMVIEMAAW